MYAREHQYDDYDDSDDNDYDDGDDDNNEEEEEDDQLELRKFPLLKLFASILILSTCTPLIETSTFCRLKITGQSSDSLLD